MRLGLTLGAALAFAVLCAICWHRGSVINDLHQQVGVLQQANAQFILQTEYQNTQVEALKRAGEDRATVAAAAVGAAKTVRASHESRAVEILSVPAPRDDLCAAAEDLIDRYRKAGAL